MVTSGFHLWQFEVFNSGVEGLVMLLFWLDLWEIFFLPAHGVWTGDLWISSPALYHCAMVTSGFHLWQFEVFNSGAGGLVVVLCWLDLWEIFFLPALRFELGTSTLPLHPSVFQFSPLTNSGIQLWCRGIGGGVVLIGPMRDFIFGHTRVWSGASRSLVLHSTIAPWQLVVFTSDNLRY